MKNTTHTKKWCPVIESQRDDTSQNFVESSFHYGLRQYFDRLLLSDAIVLRRRTSQTKLLSPLTLYTFQTCPLEIQHKSQRGRDLALAPF